MAIESGITDQAGFDAWQKAMKAQLAPEQAAIRAQNAYQGQYNSLLNDIARASTRSIVPTGQTNPATGGYTFGTNGVRNAPGIGPYLMNTYGIKGIDPGAFDFARTFLTGVNKANPLPVSDLNSALTPDLQARLQAFQTQYGGQRPGDAPGPGGGQGMGWRTLARLESQLASGATDWQKYQTEQANARANQQSAYNDMMGGNYYGGVIPTGVNPNIQQPWAPPQAPQGLGEGMGGGGGFSGTGQAADTPNPNRAARLAGQQPQGLQSYGQTGIDGVMVPAAAPQQPGPPGWDQGVAGGVQNNPWNWLNQSQPSWTQQQNPMTFGTSPWSFASK